MSTWIIIICVLSILLFIFITISILLIVFRFRSSIGDATDYRLSDVAKACSSENSFCLCKNDSSKEKLCYKIDPVKNVVIISIPFLKSETVLPPMDQLSSDENNPFTFRIKQRVLGAFRHPLENDVVCLRVMDQSENPQRLCLQISTKRSFLSGPTSSDYVQL